ncbi:MAG: hypothetical protein MMC23_005346 [Stictis urceolatum]|nr:hypothetical protein [Stictis urceolata]
MELVVYRLVAFEDDSGAADTIDVRNERATVTFGETDGVWDIKGAELEMDAGVIVLFEDHKGPADTAVIKFERIDDTELEINKEPSVAFVDQRGDKDGLTVEPEMKNGVSVDVEDNSSVCVTSDDEIELGVSDKSEGIEVGKIMTEGSTLTEVELVVRDRSEGIEVGKVLVQEMVSYMTVLVELKVDVMDKSVGIDVGKMSVQEIVS